MLHQSQAALKMCGKKFCDSKSCSRIVYKKPSCR